MRIQKDLSVGDRCRRAFRRTAAACAIMVASIMPLKSAVAEESAEIPQETASTESWMAVRPAYAIASNQLMLRLEGGLNFRTGTSLYAFLDLQPSEADSVSLDTFYGEARVLQRIYRGLSAYAELDAGSGTEPVFRPGIAYSATLEGMTLQARLAPWAFGGAGDVQLGFYECKTFGNRIFQEALVDINFLSATIYAEIAADVLLPRGFSLGLQIRLFSDLREGQTDVTPLVRVSASF